MELIRVNQHIDGKKSNDNDYESDAEENTEHYI